MADVSPEDVLRELGRDVIRDGRLKQLQTRLQFSANAMAEMLHISPTTYRAWIVNPDTRIWGQPALKVGEFYRDAVDMLAVLREEGYVIDSYIPLHKVPMEIGWPHEVLMRAVRSGKVIADDFEVLGLWVPRSELDRLRKERQHVAA